MFFFKTFNITSDLLTFNITFDLLKAISYKFYLDFSWKTCLMYMNALAR